MVNVVEIEAADGQRFQVVHGGGFRHFLAQGGVFRREKPRNERGEPAGIFLNAAEALKVIDAVAKLLAAAEHHGGGGAQAEGMGGAVHALPLIGGALEAGDAGANFVVEDFGSATGDGVKAGIAQPRDGVAHGQAGDLGDGKNLRRGKAVQVESREARLDGAQQIFVILEGQIGIEAPLHQDAGAAQGDGFFDFSKNGFQGEDVAFL